MGEINSLTTTQFVIIVIIDHIFDLVCKMIRRRCDDFFESANVSEEVIEKIRKWKSALRFYDFEYDENLTRLKGHEYIILGCIGEGRHGKVYVAVKEYVDDEMLYTLKVSEDKKTTDKEFENLKRFGYCNHFVHIFSKMDVNDGEVLVESFGGISLSRLLKERGVMNNTDLFIHIAYAVLKAIECAHRRSMLMGNLKPSNILVQVPKRVTDRMEMGDVKKMNCIGWSVMVQLCDLGSSHEIEDGTRVEGRVSGYEYGAYESSVLGTCDVECDVASYGLVLFRMVCGTSLFKAMGYGDINRRNTERCWERIKSWYDKKWGRGLKKVKSESGSGRESRSREVNERRKRKRVEEEVDEGEEVEE
jgi:serine/threonine protein kinase